MVSMAPALRITNNFQRILHDGLKILSKQLNKKRISIQIMLTKVIFINILDERKAAEEELFSTHKYNPNKYKYKISKKIQRLIFLKSAFCPQRALGRKGCL